MRLAPRAVGLVLLLGACRSQPTHLSLPESAAAPAPRFSLVFVIHGDGSYLYHDSTGVSHEADQEALGQAVAVAESNPQAEVFLFHQIRARGSRANGRFFLYRFGRLVLSETYRRDSGGVDAEAALFRDHSLSLTGSRETLRFFLYFGHQIPERSRPGYHASLPSTPWGLPDLATALSRFHGPEGRFDLLVLSTCNNGTPTAISLMVPEARHLIASPADLHLSHLGMQALHGMHRHDPPDAYEIGLTLARQSFADLSERVSTIITIGLYDLDRVAPRLAPLQAALRLRLQDSDDGILEFYDCGEDPLFPRVEDLEGVKIFYRPPRFGRLRTTIRHSGLQCFRIPQN